LINKSTREKKTQAYSNRKKSLSSCRQTAEAKGGRRRGIEITAFAQTQRQRENLWGGPQKNQKTYKGKGAAKGASRKEGSYTLETAIELGRMAQVWVEEKAK